MDDDRSLTPVAVDNAFKKRLAAKDARMQSAVLKAIRQLRIDHRHPGLRTHRIQGQPGVYGARLDRGNRLTFRWEGETIVLLNHCNHQEVLGR